MIRKTTTLLFCLVLVAGFLGVAPAGAAPLALLTSVSPLGEQPTAVTLLSFTAESQAESVLLTWETASEADNAGFHVLRSAGMNEPQELLAIIPSQAPGSIQGFLYTYEDLDVQAGETYYYWLRDIGLSGGSTLYGPAVVEFGGPTAVGLAGLSANPAGVAAPAVAAGLAAVAGLALAARGLAARRRRPGL